MRTALAVDAGGTTTRVVLLDESGRCLGVGRSGGGNPISVGPATAMDNMTSAIVAAIDGFPEAAPELVLATMAGTGTVADLEGEEGRLAEAGINAPIELEPDILSAWFSGTASGEGVVLVVGTGTVGGVVAGGELVHIVDGSGWLLGDAGSGFWIGREVARAVAEDLDGHGPATALTEAVMARIGEPAYPSPRGRASGTHKLQGFVYGSSPVALAAFAPLAFQAADDAVAQDIVTRAADEVERVARAVVDPTSHHLVVLAGGLMGPGSPIAERLVGAFGDRCVRAESGLAGAALLALRRMGVAAGEAELARIKASLAAIS